MLLQSLLRAEASGLWGAAFGVGAAVCSAGVPAARAEREAVSPCEMEPSCAEIKSGRLVESAESGGGCETEPASGHARLLIWMQKKWTSDREFENAQG